MWKRGIREGGSYWAHWNWNKLKRRPARVPQTTPPPAPRRTTRLRLHVGGSGEAPPPEEHAGNCSQLDLLGNRTQVPSNPVQAPHPLDSLKRTRSKGLLPSTRFHGPLFVFVCFFPPPFLFICSCHRPLSTEKLTRYWRCAFWPVLWSLLSFYWFAFAPAAPGDRSIGTRHLGARKADGRFFGRETKTYNCDPHAWEKSTPDLHLVLARFCFSVITF